MLFLLYLNIYELEKICSRWNYLKACSYTQSHVIGHSLINNAVKLWGLGFFFKVFLVSVHFLWCYDYFCNVLLGLRVDASALFKRCERQGVTVTCQYVQVSAKRSVTLMFSFSSGLGSGWCYIYGFPCHIPLTSPVLPAAAWQGPLSSQRDSRHTQSCGFSDSDCSGEGCHLSVNLGAEAGTGEAEVTGSGAALKTMTPRSAWAFFQLLCLLRGCMNLISVGYPKNHMLGFNTMQKYDLKDEIHNFFISVSKAN